LRTVLEFIRLCKEMGVHLEITTLVVPDLNNTENELEEAADFIASVDAQIPWHLSAYHPDYRWNAPPTDGDFLLRAAERAKKKLAFVYTGNLSSGNDTYCSCGEVLVRRRGYRVDAAGLSPGHAGEKNYRCAKCGEPTKIAL